MNPGIPASLYKAVCSGDVQKVKDILSTGADIHFPIKEWTGESTLLHYASNAEIVRELILHGANVNAKDYNGRTPLHKAVSNAKCLNAVKELLKNGADPNARNCQGTPALTQAIINKNLEIIKELLEYGADINIITTSPTLRYPTPLAIAVSSYEDCAELLIRMTVLKNFDSGYDKVINLNQYSECENYSNLSNYLEDCIIEIIQMKAERANDNISLYDFVLKNTENVKFLYEKVQNIGEHLCMDYPIYHDVIIKKIQLFLRRASLLNKFLSLQISNNNNEQNDVLEKTVFLNHDCLNKIAEYLSNDDLTLFLSSFNQHIDLYTCF